MTYRYHEFALKKRHLAWRSHYENQSMEDEASRAHDDLMTRQAS